MSSDKYGRNVLDFIKFAINLASDIFWAATSVAVGLPRAISNAKFGPDIIANLLLGKVLFITSLIKDVDFISIPFAQLTKIQFFLIIFFKGLRVDWIYWVGTTIKSTSNLLKSSTELVTFNDSLSLILSKKVFDLI